MTTRNKCHSDKFSLYTSAETRYAHRMNRDDRKDLIMLFAVMFVIALLLAVFER